jgi:hypothetical protein
MITLNANKRCGRCVNDASLLIYKSSKNVTSNIMYTVRDEKLYLTASSLARVAVNRPLSPSSPEIGANSIVIKRLLEHEKPSAIITENRCTLVDVYEVMPILMDSFMMTEEAKKNIIAFWSELVEIFQINPENGEINRKKASKEFKQIVKDATNDDELTAKVIAIIKAMKEQGVL